MAGSAKEFLIKIVSSLSGDGLKKAAQETEKLQKSTEQATEATEKNTEATNQNTQAQQSNSGSIDAAGKKAGIFAGIVGGLTVKALNMATQALRWLWNEAKETVVQFARLETSAVRLNQSLTNMGQYSVRTSRELQRLAQQISRRTGTDRGSWLEAFQRLIQQGVQSQDIPKYARSVEHLAGVIGGDVSQASAMWSQVMAGNYNVLKQYGISVTDAADRGKSLSEVMAQLANRGAGLLGQQHTLAEAAGGVKQAWNELLVAGGQVLDNTGWIRDGLRTLTVELRSLAGGVDTTTQSYRQMADQKLREEAISSVMRTSGLALTGVHKESIPVIRDLETAIQNLREAKKGATEATQVQLDKDIEELENLKQLRKFLYENTGLREAAEKGREKWQATADGIHRKGQRIEEEKQRQIEETAQAEAKAHRDWIRRRDDLLQNGAKTVEDIQFLHDLMAQYTEEYSHADNAVRDLLGSTRHSWEEWAQIADGYALNILTTIPRIAHALAGMEYPDFAAEAKYEWDEWRQKQISHYLEQRTFSNHRLQQLREIQKATDEYLRTSEESAVREKIREKNEAARQALIETALRTRTAGAEEIVAEEKKATAEAALQAKTMDELARKKDALITKHEEELEQAKKVKNETTRTKIIDDLRIVQARELAELAKVEKDLLKANAAREQAVALDMFRLRIQEMRAAGDEEAALQEEETLKRLEMQLQLQEKHGKEAQKYVERWLKAEATAKERAVKQDRERLRIQELLAQGRKLDAQDIEKRLEREQRVIEAQKTHGAAAAVYVDQMMAAEDAVEARLKKEKEIDEILKGQKKTMLDIGEEEWKLIERQAQLRGLRTRRQRHANDEVLFVDGQEIARKSLVAKGNEGGISDVGQSRLDNWSIENRASMERDIDRPTTTQQSPRETAATPATPVDLTPVTEAVTAATQSSQTHLQQLLLAIHEMSRMQQEGMSAVRAAIGTFAQSNAARHSQLADQIAAARN